MAGAGYGGRYPLGITFCSTHLTGVEQPPPMLFPTLDFLVFFTLVWLAYWGLKRHAYQNPMLLVASYFFYGYWDWRFLGLILGSTVLDYCCGLALESARGPARKLWLGLSLAVNLGALGFFKYFDFFATSAAEFLNAIGLGASDWTLGLLLPVGISFYTFQTLSYTIDRYRGNLPPARDFISFALFVSFFPQLVAGPIVRASEFLPQVESERRFRWSDQAGGIQLSIWGLFKKCVVADNLAPFVDSVFSEESRVGILVRVLAVYAFALQIYCDFSGYTDIARGTAQMLGFRFPHNFRMPYFSQGPSEFWRRWHISLSTWLRDYLYIPLGGNRKGPRKTYLFLMITMVLGGLWHGAAYNFVLWGLYQGLLLIIQRAWQQKYGAAKDRSPLARAFVTFVFFQFVCLGWLLFRAESLSQITEFLTAGGGLLDGLKLSDSLASGLVIGFVGGCIVFGWDWLVFTKGEPETPLEHARPLPAAVVLLGLYLAVSLAGNFLGNEFIYFQF